MPDPMSRERETEIRRCLMAFALWDAVALEEQIAIARDLLAEVDRLRKALRKFGIHPKWCASGWSQPCDCGFAALLPGDARASRPEGGEYA